MADACGEHGGVGDFQHSVVGAQRDVGQAHLADGSLEDAPEGPRADADVVSYDERPRYQQDKPSEDVAEALLRGDAEHDSGHAGTHKSVRLHLEHCEHCEHDEHVADDGRKDPYGAAGAWGRSPLDDAAEDSRDPVGREDARDQQHDRADPGDDPQVKRGPMSDAAELGSDYERNHRNGAGDGPNSPLPKTTASNRVDRVVTSHVLPSEHGNLVDLGSSGTSGGRTAIECSRDKGGLKP